MKIKIKTIEQLEDYLIADLAWRKKEIISLKILIEKDTVNEPILLRAGIALLCAHFEGFIKKSCNSYIAYVSSQNEKYSGLKDNFAALKMEKEFVECAKSEKHSRHSNLIKKYRELQKIKFRIDFFEEDPILSTKSNPSSEVLRELLFSIGIDSEIFETKTNYIDSNLLAERNRIVHGQRSDLRREDFLSTYEIIIEIIDEFKELVIESAKNKVYLKAV